MVVRSQVVSLILSVNTVLNIYYIIYASTGNHLSSVQQRLTYEVPLKYFLILLALLTMEHKK